MRISPASRTKQLLEGQGYRCGMWERWNPFVPRPDGGMGVRQDGFGFIDLVAIRSGETPILVQATSSDNMAARIEKIANLDDAYVWLGTGHVRIRVYGWVKRPKCKKRPRAIYEHRMTQLDSDMLLAIRIPPVPTES